jgi:hypothetical protein
VLLVWPVEVESQILDQLIILDIEIVLNREERITGEFFKMLLVFFWAHPLDDAREVPIILTGKFASFPKDVFEKYYLEAVEVR